MENQLMSYDIESEISKLNAPQQKAVKTRKKHVLVLAGAGSGKTKVLTSRIAYILDMGAEPDSILAVTFTNKAANEMKNRIKSMVSSSTNLNDMWVGTFHSLCNKIISTHYSTMGLAKNYQTLDSDDQKSLIRRIVEELEVEKNEKFDKKALVQDGMNFINKSKENGLRPNKAHDLLISLNIDQINLEIYERYEQTRMLNNTIDFGDMLLYVVELFRDHPEIKKQYQHKFSHILVDEFQDTNKIQYQWAKDLSEGNYLFVVGDDDQSIYGWRGAKVSNIIDFAKNHNDTEIVKLEQNYRSTKKILACANSVIKVNTKRLGKSLWSDQADGSDICIIESDSPEEEARVITSIIESKIMNDNSIKYSDFAILYRNNAISRSFEAKLTEKKIPYKLIGGTSFWARKEIKDVLSYMSLVANDKNDVSFERTVNTPSRGIGKKTIEKIRIRAQQNNANLFITTSEMIDAGEIKGKSGKALSEYIDFINDARSGESTITPYNIIMKIIKEIPLTDSYYSEGEEKGDERKENIHELSYFAKEFVNEDDKDDLDAFLAQAALQSDNAKDKDTDSVQLMTLHASKGLEFPFVFVAGFEQGTFPSKRALISPHKKNLEEERRLAYVGITRAEKELWLSFAGYRYNQSTQYSMFMDELPVEFLSYKTSSSYGISSIGRKIKSYKIKTDQPLSSKPFKKSQEDDNSASLYKVGQTINHKKWGKGLISKVEFKRDINSYIIDVSFDFIGRKNIIIPKTI
jgi:DNA helicase-2/ATP-dependent DNA helicase PcrA